MSKTLRTAPYLPFYFFKQLFRCVEDLEAELESIAGNICNLTEAAKENNWFEFWQAEGNEIVLRLWKIKYKDYIDDTTEERNLSEEIVEGVPDAIEKTASLNSSTSDEILLSRPNIEDTLSWDILWEEHNAEVYAEQYQKFENIFENYCWLLSEALKNHTDTEKQQTTDYYSEWRTELEELKIAGLPTAFGNRAQSNKKTRKNKRVKKESEERFYELAEADFNDDCGEGDTEDVDEEIYFSATDTSDYEFEMPPVKPNRSNDSFEHDDDGLHSTFNRSISKSKKNRMFRYAPAFMQEEKEMQKYWRQRFSLFSRFDEGIQLDRESWFSVTPEKVAQHMARRIARDVAGSSNDGITVVDGFCGCGGNTIQFAMTCKKVIAIDIDSQKIEMAKHNANIYGVADKIEFIVGDFLEVSQSGKLKADAVFLSPPWGGPEYKSVQTYNIETCLDPVSATELMRVTRLISNNIAFFLPRNSDMKQIIKLAGVGNVCEVEHNYLDTRVVGLTAFYGNCVAKQGF